jgi:hypothetical protein
VILYKRDGGLTYGDEDTYKHEDLSPYQGANELEVLMMRTGQTREQIATRIAHGETLSQILVSADVRDKRDSDKRDMAKAKWDDWNQTIVVKE